MLEIVFTAVLNMSLTASVAAVLIICARFIFNKKLPKVFSYSLWSLVLARLLIPLSLASIFSLFNALPSTALAVYDSQVLSTIRYISSDTGTEQAVEIDTANEASNNDVKGSFPGTASKASGNHMQGGIHTASLIWISGTLIILAFSLWSYYKVSSILKTATLYKNDNLFLECSSKLRMHRKVPVYTTDRIDTPVVYGLIKPRIVFPTAMAQSGNETDLQSIIIHELVHIKRLDFIAKPISVLALCIHWFNPIIWLSFILSQKDMELACDEKVISISDKDIRSDYATALINLASNQNIGGLLAFGESNIKSRVKGIISYKKPSFRAIAVGTVIFTIMAAVLLTNPGIIASNAENEPKIPQLSQEIRMDSGDKLQAVSEEIVSDLKDISGGDSASVSGEEFAEFLTNDVVDGIHYKSELLENIKRGGISSGFNIKRIKVRNDFGFVKILPAASKDIRIEAEVRVKCNDPEKAAVYAKAAFEIKEGDITEFLSKAPAASNKDDYGHASIDFTIYAPKEVDIEIVNGFGDTSIKGINGTAAVESNSGSIAVENVTGDVKVDNVFGSITISDVSGKLKVINDSGSIKVNNTKGTAHIELSMGDVMVENIDGDVAVNINGGNIRVINTKGNADINNKLGNIIFRSSSIDESVIYAKTDFGEIHSSKRLDISKSIGLVKAEGSFGSGKFRIELNTDYGNIDIQ